MKKVFCLVLLISPLFFSIVSPALADDSLTIHNIGTDSPNIVYIPYTPQQSNADHCVLTDLDNSNQVYDSVSANPVYCTFADDFNGSHHFTLQVLDVSDTLLGHADSFRLCDNGYPEDCPQVNPLSGASINQGNSYVEDGSFTDPDSTLWTATVDYGDGTGVQPLTLSDTDFSLNHIYNTQGTYTVTVVVTDDAGFTGTGTATVVVTNPTPTTLTPTADTFIKQGSKNENEGANTVLRIQQSGSNRALLKFDEAQIQAAVGSSQNYTAQLHVTIANNSNNWGTNGRSIGLYRLAHDWTEGNGFISGNSPINRGTGSGATWNCATDSNIHNQNDDCSGSAIWNMTNSSLWPFASAASATSMITNNQSGVVTFDVTSDVQSFLNGTNQNYGWLIKKTDESVSGAVDFGSKESANSPQLIITPN